MNTDPEHDDLWRLLGKAKQPDVSPFFARNVLRAVREDPKPAGFGAAAASWTRRWIWSAGLAGACAAMIFSFARLSHRTMEQRDDAPAVLAQQLVANPDYDVITHLDELAANEETSLWLDDSLR